MMQKLFDGNLDGMGYVETHDCPHCKYGLRETPPFLSAITLAEQRAFQAALHMIVFCDCERGRQYKAHLRNVYAGMMRAGYYSKYVIDTMTQKPMVDEDGKPLTWFKMTQERVLQESVNESIAYFRSMND